MANYVARIADHELDARLRVMGAVLIEGPKACGKTATASQIANTIIRLDEDPVARAQLDFDPQALFSGRPPILFDEWQVEPEIWNRVRRQVDDREEKGQFILTGSARPRDNANRHSGAGRFSVMQMRPMSLFETEHSTSEISLANLLAGDWLADYLRQVIEVDVPEMGHRRNPGNLRRLLESLARGVGQPVKLSDLAKDVGGEGGPIAHETITGYLDALRRLWLTDDSAAWRPHMRSRTRLRTAPVRYFVDPSIGTAALSIGSAELKRDPLALGFHFEALAIRDLRIYAQLHRGQVDSWRDANGNEVDAVLTARDNTWAAFDIKLNPRDVDAGAASVLKFAANVDTDRHKRPACLGVITSTGAGGLRPDGVHVIPIGALGP